MKLILLGAVLLAAFLFWRRRQKGRREAFIDSYCYAQFLDQRLAKRRPALSANQRAEVFATLGEYFQLCRQANRQMVAMPSQVVDDAWHEFILFTRHYDEFCRLAFGRFLHHTPVEAMRSPTQASAGLKRAWRLACGREKIDPRHPERLPRLFAIDAKLMIAGGFIYQLDCLAAGKAGSASGFCASHIGCSSGCGGDSGSADTTDGGSAGDGGGSSCGGGGCGGGGGD